MSDVMASFPLDIPVLEYVRLRIAHGGKADLEIHELAKEGAALRFLHADGTELPADQNGVLTGLVQRRAGKAQATTKREPPKGRSAT